MYLREENNYPKAVGISIVIMGILLVLSFFIVIGKFKPDQEFGMGGMVVNYGTSVSGMGTDYTSIEEPSMSPNANNKLTDQIVPDNQISPSESSLDAKDIITQNTEEAISVNTKTTKANASPSANTENKPTKQTINENALYKGKKSSGTGQGDGTGTTAGNQGSINGDPMAPNYGEGGSGFGDTAIPLRRFTNLTPPQDDGQKTGKVAVRISVNKNGVVVNATPGVKGTTLSDSILWEKCKAALMGATLNKEDNGPDIQIGVVIFNFKVK